MKLLPHLLTLAVLPMLLALAGLQSIRRHASPPEPLVVVDGSHRHYHGDKHRYRHREFATWSGTITTRSTLRDHRRGGFCPPGQAKKGRCWK